MSAPVTYDAKLPCRILLVAKDSLLRETRKEVLLSLGFHIAAPVSEGEAFNLAQTEPFDVLILCSSVDPSMKLRLATGFRRGQPHGRVIEITDAPSDEPSGKPDATVIGLDGPIALRRAIEEQLRFAH